MSNTTGEHEPTGERQELGLRSGEFYMPSLLGVFALSEQLYGRTPYGESFIREHVLVNTPRTPLAIKKGREIIPLETAVVDMIHARATRLIAVPNGERWKYTHTELARFQALLDGTSIGMSEIAVGESLGLDRHEFELTSQEARVYLGATNQASVMYGARLHGYVPSIRPEGLHVPRLTLNRKLHFYLAALGFDWNEAAELTDSTPESVKTVRGYIRTAFRAQTIAQAVSNGFETELFMTLREYGIDADH